MKTIEQWCAEAWPAGPDPVRIAAIRNEALEHAAEMADSRGCPALAADIRKAERKPDRKRLMAVVDDFIVRLEQWHAEGKP